MYQDIIEQNDEKDVVISLQTELDFNLPFFDGEGADSVVEVPGSTG